MALPEGLKPPECRHKGDRCPNRHITFIGAKKIQFLLLFLQYNGERRLAEKVKTSYGERGLAENVRIPSYDV